MEIKHYFAWKIKISSPYREIMVMTGKSPIFLRWFEMLPPVSESICSCASLCYWIGLNNMKLNVIILPLSFKVRDGFSWFMLHSSLCFNEKWTILSRLILFSVIFSSLKFTSCVQNKNSCWWSSFSPDTLMLFQPAWTLNIKEKYSGVLYFSGMEIWSRAPIPSLKLESQISSAGFRVSY